MEQDKKQVGVGVGGGRWSKRAMGEISILVSMVFFGGSFTGQRYAMVNGAAPITYNAGRFIVSTTLLYLFKPILQQLMVDVENEYGVADVIDKKDNDKNGKDDSSSNSNSNSNSSSNSSRNYDSISHQIDHHSTGSQSLQSSALLESNGSATSDLWLWGGVCGVSNFVGSVLQQTSLVSISVAKCGFITGMYVVMVPLFEWFIPGHRESVNRIGIIAAAFSMVGMYFLSGCAEQADGSSCWNTSEGKGELLVFISVFCWVGSIIGSDIGLEKKVCPVSITCIDFLICTVMNLILAIYLEPKQWQYPFEGIQNSLGITIFVGFTEAIAFLLSTYGQKEIDATRASLLMSLESVSSAAGGYLFMKETLTAVEIFGCFIMFAATLIPSLSDYYNENYGESATGEGERIGDETNDSSETNNKSKSNHISDYENELLPLLGNKGSSGGASSSSLTNNSSSSSVAYINGDVRDKKQLSSSSSPLSLATVGLRVRSNSKDLEMAGTSTTGRRSRTNSSNMDK